MKPAADDDGSARRRHHFDRRGRVAREGRRLPPLEEPLLDMPFLGNDLAADAQAWAEILLPRLTGTGGDGTPPAAGMDGSLAWPAKSQLRRMRTDTALPEAQKPVLSAAVRALIRDRFRVLRFPALAASLLREVVRDQGLDPRWVVPLDGEELDALTVAWSGGSLRRLRTLVEHVVGLRAAVVP